MNANLNNGDMSRGIVLINNHNLYQFNESREFNDMDWVIKNGDVSGVYCFMNNNTIY